MLVVVAMMQAARLHPTAAERRIRRRGEERELIALDRGYAPLAASGGVGIAGGGAGKMTPDTSPQSVKSVHA